jgi:hypothetical protein
MGRANDGFFPVDELLLDAVIDWSYRRIVGGEDPMTGAKPASELAAALDGAICPEGIGGHEALRRWAHTIVPATRAMGDAMNLAYVPASPTAAALTFDLAVSSAQIMGALWETGAGAIAAENQALRWLADLAGWPADAGGTFVQGGTVGNLSALVAARERARARHATPPARWRIAAGRAAHSSITSAARVMDVDVLWVDGDAAGRIDGPALVAALAREGEDAHGVFAVVANVGATNAGIIDRLDSLADVCAERGLWLHVDGAYGLASLVAPSMRERLAGSSASTASWSTRTSGSSHRTTAVRWCTATRLRPEPPTRSTPGTSSTSTATSGTPATTRSSSAGAPAGSRSGSRWPPTAPITTPPRSSTCSRSLARSPTASARAATSSSSPIPTCRSCCSVVPGGPRSRWSPGVRSTPGWARR